MGMLELIQQKSFIGREFLTWLWFLSETQGACDAGEMRVEIELLGPILLEAHYGDARAQTLKGDAPGTAPEARTALLEGKKLRRGKFKLAVGDNDWTCTLDGDTLQLSGLNMPKTGKMGFEEQLGVRLSSVQEYEAMIGRLFEQFLELRLDAEAWAEEVPRIHEWVESK